MVSVINFGSSPFRMLFLLVLGILCAVVAANLVAFLVTKIIDLRIARMKK